MQVVSLYRNKAAISGGKKNKIWRIKGALTCRQGEGHQVGEEVAGEVALALVQRGGHLAADLLRQLGTHHGRDALGRLLGHLLRTAEGPGGKEDWGGRNTTERFGECCQSLYIRSFH